MRCEFRIVRCAVEDALTHTDLHRTGARRLALVPLSTTRLVQAARGAESRRVNLYIPRRDCARLLLRALALLGVLHAHRERARQLGLLVLRGQRS